MAACLEQWDRLEVITSAMWIEGYGESMLGGSAAPTGSKYELLSVFGTNTNPGALQW